MSWLTRKLAEAALKLTVHSLCRLVKKQHIGCGKQHFSECKTLLLAAGYIKRVARKHAFKLQKLRDMQKQRLFRIKLF